MESRSGVTVQVYGVRPCLFKDQASLRGVPSAVPPATSGPAADNGDSQAPSGGPTEQHLSHPGHSPATLDTVQPRGLEIPAPKSQLRPPDFALGFWVTTVSSEAIEVRRSSLWGQETAGAPMSGLGRITIPLDQSFPKIF